MNVVETGMIACWALCAAGLAAYAASVAREITYVTLADGRKTERRLPLVMRLLLPFVPNLRRLVGGRQFAAVRAQADQMIVSGGLEGLLTGAEFVALKFLVPIVCGVAWAAFVFALSGLLPDSFVSDNRVLLAALSGPNGRAVGIRPGAGYYAESHPRDMVNKCLSVAREAERCRDYGFVRNVCYEQETYPRRILQKSPGAIVTEGTLALARPL